MHELTVRHSKGTYPIRFAGIRQAATSLPLKSFVVTDRNVATHYGHLLSQETGVYVLEPGESSKSVECLERIWSWLAQSGANRRSTLVAMGGGVVGDIGGFAAATYMRGIECVQIATSLMAMVDSSIGGKVGIDLPEGKNLAGSFYPPKRVEICVDALQTLPERHIRNGLAEVIKYAFIADPGLIEAVRGQNQPVWELVVPRCVEIKAGIVERDEFETGKERATLNFGHTIGHAVEAITGYRDILHGEAVAIGMVAESYIAAELGFSDRGTYELVRTVVETAGLPCTHDCIGDPKLIEFMRADKKRTGEGLAFSFVESPGTCKLVESVSEDAVLAALQCL